MKLERLSLANCGGLEKLDIAFESDVTLIAGINGVGKSTLLRAIGVIFSRMQTRMGVTSTRPLALARDDIFVGADRAALAMALDFDGRKARAEFVQQSSLKARKSLKSLES
jgi:predicted ATP-binding protein involved in virulence